MWAYHLHWVVVILITTADYFNKLEPAVNAFETKIGLMEYENADSTGIVLPDTISIPPYYRDPTGVSIDTSRVERYNEDNYTNSKKENKI